MQSQAMHKFPEPVAKELRKAIYYDKGYGKDPKKAFQYYKEALMVATDLGMNPYSEEFIGMRVRMAEFLEQHKQFGAAITVLEKEREYAYEFLEKAKAQKDIEIPDAQWSRMVALAVKLGVKLGKLYSDEDVDNPEAAQAALVRAVETLLKERIRRQEEGIKEEAQQWLNEEEIGASLEELGHSYMDSRQPEFALPLFLQALSLSPANSCHSAMLSMSYSCNLLSNNLTCVFSEPSIGSIVITKSRDGFSIFCTTQREIKSTNANRSGSSEAGETLGREGSYHGSGGAATGQDRRMRHCMCCNHAQSGRIGPLVWR
jgi:tetratricopeptide (TPR) repeat protein